MLRCAPGRTSSWLAACGGQLRPLVCEQELEDERARVDLCRDVAERRLEPEYGLAGLGVAAAVDHMEDPVGFAVAPRPSTHFGRHPLLDRLRVTAVVLGPRLHGGVHTVVLRKPRRHVALPVIDVGDPGGVQSPAFVGHDRISGSAKRLLRLGDAGAPGP